MTELHISQSSTFVQRSFFRIKLASFSSATKGMTHKKAKNPRLFESVPMHIKKENIKMRNLNSACVCDKHAINRLLAARARLTIAPKALTFNRSYGKSKKSSNS